MAIKREYNRYLRSKKEVDTILFMCRESRKSYKKLSKATFKSSRES